MPFIPHHQTDQETMLDVLGIKSATDLFNEIPNELKDKAQNAKIHPLLEKPLSECEITRLMQDRAPKNNPNKSYLGAGAYPHFIPAAVWSVASRGEFLTAYTPYQAEASQGTLQVIYEYQSLMTELMSQEVCNASVYDGATALAESILMSIRIKKNRANNILVPESLHPLYRQSLTTLLPENINIIPIKYDPKTGVTDLDHLKQIISENSKSSEKSNNTNIASLVIPQPNFFGNLEPVDQLTKIAKQADILTIAVVNPMTCAILKPPGEWGDNIGADITCGEGQPLGIPLSYGGPYFGFILTRKKYIREIPGRLVGKAFDANNKPGFTLTLQSREQHIRRAKAKSNICTNQGLCVTAATIYMSLVGEKGLKNAINKSQSQAEKLYQKLLEFPEITPLFENNNFINEFAINIKNNKNLVKKLEELGFQPGICLDKFYSELENGLLIAVTETKSDQDIDDLISAINNIYKNNLNKKTNNKIINNINNKTPKHLTRDNKIKWPIKSELEVIRHFTLLSQKNFCIDTHFYPLGSCTMKYNPKAAHALALLSGFANAHPLAPSSHTKGLLQCLYELQETLKYITGMHDICLTPMAGAQGEYTGLKMIKAYHDDKKDFNRTEIIVPSAAHGTNPASAAMCGFTVKEVSCEDNGDVNIEELKSLISEKTAGIMLTNPSTLGVFEQKILEISKLIHDAGGLLYYDGANLNAILGHARPGDMGFDAIHLNLHKTFATPHGGGGPGGAPVAVSKRLAPFLPTPRVDKITNKTLNKTSEDLSWIYNDNIKAKKSIGTLSAFKGNFGVLIRAYIYIRMLGNTGLKRVSEHATLNANYLMKKLEKVGYTLAFPDRRASHEFIITAKPLTKLYGVTALDIAKRLLDYKMHAPTIYFPLLIDECLLIEPTETESLEQCDNFINAMEQIMNEIKISPEMIKTAPHEQSINRLNEVAAARNLDLAIIY
jgi:glycine dehydrogenase subunit 2